MSFEVREGSKTIGPYKTLGGAKSAARARARSSGGECVIYETKRGARARRVGSYSGRVWKDVKSAAAKSQKSDRKSEKKKAEKKEYKPVVKRKLV